MLVFSGVFLPVPLPLTGGGDDGRLPIRRRPVRRGQRDICGLRTQRVDVAGGISWTRLEPHDFGARFRLPRHRRLIATPVGLRNVIGEGSALMGAIADLVELSARALQLANERLKGITVHCPRVLVRAGPVRMHPQK